MTNNKIVLNIAQTIFEIIATVGMIRSSLQREDLLKGREFRIGSAAVHPVLSGIYRFIITALVIRRDLNKVWGESFGREKQSLIPNSAAFLKSLGNLLVMDTKCIMSESYCEGEVNALGDQALFAPTSYARRKALYFWLGFISGTATRMIPLRKIGNKIVGTVTEKLPRIPTLSSSEFGG